MATNTFGRITMRRLIAPKISSRIASLRSNNAIAKSATALNASRSFSASIQHDHDEELEHRMPVTTFTEDEEMVRDAARIWANQELRPLVREMDNECKTRPEVVQGLFDHGFMGMVSHRVQLKSNYLILHYCFE